MCRPGRTQCQLKVSKPEAAEAASSEAATLEEAYLGTQAEEDFSAATLAGACSAKTQAEACLARTLEVAFSGRTPEAASLVTPEVAFSARAVVVACSEPTQEVVFSATLAEACLETRAVGCLEIQAVVDSSAIVGVGGCSVPRAAAVGSSVQAHKAAYSVPTLVVAFSETRAVDCLGGQVEDSLERTRVVGSLVQIPAVASLGKNTGGGLLGAPAGGSLFGTPGAQQMGRYGRHVSDGPLRAERPGDQPGSTTAIGLDDAQDSLQSHFSLPLEIPARIGG